MTRNRGGRRTAPDLNAPGNGNRRHWSPRLRPRSHGLFATSGSWRWKMLQTIPQDPRHVWSIAPCAIDAPGRVMASTPRPCLPMTLEFRRARWTKHSNRCLTFVWKRE